MGILTSYRLLQSLKVQLKTFQESSKYLNILDHFCSLQKWRTIYMAGEGLCRAKDKAGKCRQQKLKGRVLCFLMQVVINKVFSSKSWKKIDADPSCCFREKRKTYTL